MTTATWRAERRNEPRAPNLGTAVTHLNRWWTHEYRVEDLSAGGALLTDGPALKPGRKLRLVLRLNGLRSVWVHAWVLRPQVGARPGVAVSFVDLDPAVEDLIHDVVVAALSGRRLHPLPMDCAVDFAPAEPRLLAYLN